MNWIGPAVNVLTSSARTLAEWTQKKKEFYPEGMANTLQFCEILFFPPGTKIGFDESSIVFYPQMHPKQLTVPQSATRWFYQEKASNLSNLTLIFYTTLHLHPPTKTLDKSTSYQESNICALVTNIIENNLNYPPEVEIYLIAIYALYHFAKTYSINLEAELLQKKGKFNHTVDPHDPLPYLIDSFHYLTKALSGEDKYGEDESKIYGVGKKVQNNYQDEDYILMKKQLKDTLKKRWEERDPWADPCLEERTCLEMTINKKIRDFKQFQKEEGCAIASEN